MKTTTITDYIPHGRENAVSRGYLCALTGLSDRSVRAAIEQARNDGALILNDQDGFGYYQADIRDLDALQRQYRQDTARAMALLKRRKHIRRILKEAGRPV